MDDSSYFHRLNSNGIEWTRECLQSGEALSNAVLKNIDISSGHTSLVVIRVEHRNAVMKATPLSWSVLKDRVISPTPSAALLLNKLREIAGRYKEQLAIIVEDNLSAPGDPHLENKNSDEGRFLLFNNKFFIIQSLDKIADARKLALHLNQSDGHPLNAFVVSLNQVPDKEELTQEDVDGMASLVRGIINFAFDGETYTLFLVGEKVVNAKLA